MTEGVFPKSDGDILFASEINKIKGNLLSFPILNRINQQEDRSITLSLGSDDIFSDAYIDATGRDNTVNTSNTTALFRGDTNYSELGYRTDNFSEGSTTDQVTEAGADTTDNNWAFNVMTISSCFISQIVLYCNSSGTVDIYIKRRDNSGPTLASKTSVSLSTGSNTINFAFSDYDAGELPLAGERLYISISASGSPNIRKVNTKTYTSTLIKNDASNQNFPGEGSITAKAVVGTTSTTSVIEHTIPSGTFSSTVDTLVAKAKILETEGDAKVEHRLENATENSGWISDGTVSSFTAFTSEPTKYIVRLTARTTGTATPGLPAITGAGVYSE